MTTALRPSYTPLLLALTDFLMLVAAAALACGLASTINTEILGRAYNIPQYSTAWAAIFTLQTAIVVVYLASHAHYASRGSSPLPWWEQIRQILIICTVMLVASSFVMYQLKLPYSRLWVGLTWLLAMPLLVCGRLLARKIGLKLNMWGTRVVVVGGSRNIAETLYALASDSYSHYNVSHIWLLEKGKLNASDLPRAYAQAEIKTITPTEALTALKGFPLDTLVIHAPDMHGQMEVLLPAAQQLRLHVAFAPAPGAMSLYGMRTMPFFGSHTVLLRPQPHARKLTNRILKRILDVTGATVGMLLLAVPMLVIATMIRRDGGPALYYQMRVGKNGQMFRCWKLRSMVPNAGEALKKILAGNAELRAEWEKDFKLKNDPRITKIGHIIRKTSIDELPQLWNVLRGDMSLVGPRPIVEAELAYYGDKKADYLSSKPGLTGLWQVSGRNDTSYAYRVYLDSWYVAHWSLWTDIAIILQTVGILVSRKGAY